MNQKVRLFLIEQCIKGKTIYHHSIGDLLGLDLSSASPKKLIQLELDAISAFEYKNGRPLLSSAVIYKQKSDHDLDPSFYNLCERLKIGRAEELQQEFFRFSEFQSCQKFWKTSDNYDKYAENIGITALK
jgi:hypothetical protein